MDKPKLFVSFSGGQSSAYMAKRLSEDYRDVYDMVFGFANTGEENEETLVFCNRCDKEFGLNLVWLETVVHHGERIGSTHKIVSFETASRNGEPFEEVIRKYGIPNKAYPHCTRELKLQPIRSYIRSLGWQAYLSAVGIRADEPKRLRKDADKVGIIYPLAHLFPVDKQDINSFWEDHSFRLGLKDYQGNCKWCWKKSLRKLVTIAKESPEAFDFPARMEVEHGLSGHNVDGTKRVFFRSHMSTTDLIQISVAPSRSAAMDDSDANDGCSESCEAFIGAGE